MAYQIPAEGFASLGIEVNGLDMSQGEFFYFKVKGDKGSEVFRLEMVDRDGSKNSVMIGEDQPVTREWQQIRLSLSLFPDIHFGRLEYLLFDFTSPTGDSVKGSVSIDDLTFFSNEKNMFMRSLRDNIKGFPEKKLASRERVEELLAIQDPQKFIKEIASDTWIYFRDIVDYNNHLVLDFIEVQPDRVGDFTSVTNIGLYFMCVISAYDLGLLPKQAAIDRIQNTLKVLGRLPRWNGLWFNFYSTTNSQVTRDYISSVDNGWLAAGFIVARNSFDEVKETCTEYLEGMNFSVLYSTALGQINLGYDLKEEEASPYHYGLLCTEPRVTSLIAMGKGDIPLTHWFRMYRALPQEWTWQSQKPEGITKNEMGVDYFQGYYQSGSSGDIKIVPSWGGSMFEFLMPLIVVKEQELAPKGLGLNNKRAVDIHIRYALEEKKYPVWGMSPCSTPDGSNGGYAEFGVASAGSKGYPDDGIVTPHATFLALELRPQAVIRNLKVMLKNYNIYGKYGFYDSVDVDTGKVAYKYMALDQGMSLVSMNNFINKGIIRERFHRDPYIQKVEHLLGMEDFFPDKMEEVKPIMETDLEKKVAV
jgi:hypothetical protein